MLAGWSVVVLDNLCNSQSSTIQRLGAMGHGVPGFVQGDVRDAALLDKVIASHPITAVMHFAGLKAVGESWQYLNTLCLKV